MATVLSLAEDAYREIGAIGLQDTIGADLGALALVRFQHQLESWQAESLTLFNFTRVSYTLPSGTSSRTIGPTGDIVTAQNPVIMNGINYVVPGTNPGVETPMGRMMADQYQELSIKQLPNSLPTLWFFNPGATNGTLTFWPVVTQNVDLALYIYFGVGSPVTLSDTVIGPPGYEEAFMYQLAIRLCQPLLRIPPALTVKMAAESLARIKRPNINPPLLGVDQALVPAFGAGYNVLSDQTASPSNR
jgi:hypothetical protein